MSTSAKRLQSPKKRNELDCILKSISRVQAGVFSLRTPNLNAFTERERAQIIAINSVGPLHDQFIQGLFDKYASKIDAVHTLSQRQIRLEIKKETSLLFIYEILSPKELLEVSIKDQASSNQETLLQQMNFYPLQAVSRQFTNAIQERLEGEV